MNTHLIKKIASTKNYVKFDLNFKTSAEEDFKKFQMYLYLFLHVSLKKSLAFHFNS